MTGYVILSRLTAATGLLLLRAFSPVLFRQGEPPGPCVLLKWMRSRFCKETEAAEYTFDQVLTEYAELNKQMTSDRQQRKLRGPDWTCWCCRLSMPSAAFDAEWPKQANIFDNCLSPGHWRRCKACDEAIGLARELNQANETVRCGSCNMHQIPELFAE